MSSGAAVGFVIILVLYFVPTIVAGSRHVVNVGSVLVINLLLGWTLVGWVVALAMAARTNPARVTQNVYVAPAQELSASVQPAAAAMLPAPEPRPVAGPAPGWYRDHAGVLRWWDGARWTDHVQTAVAPPPFRG
ncbi:MAG TPA: superinfection immunity protein [Amycolatopsis sp.]|nr:superinfection immunity protein [Amycolatopsis sp.]